jgi:hypothetical protein
VVLNVEETLFVLLGFYGVDLLAFNETWVAVVYLWAGLRWSLVSS